MAAKKVPDLDSSRKQAAEKPPAAPVRIEPKTADSGSSALALPLRMAEKRVVMLVPECYASAITAEVEAHGQAPRNLLPRVAYAALESYWTAGPRHI